MNSAAYEELFDLLTVADDLTDEDRELVLEAAEAAVSLTALLAGDASPATPGLESADAQVAPTPPRVTARPPAVIGTGVADRPHIDQVVEVADVGFGS